MDRWAFILDGAWCVEFVLGEREACFKFFSHPMWVSSRAGVGLTGEQNASKAFFGLSCEVLR